jgi:hypothetical protein
MNYRRRLHPEAGPEDHDFSSAEDGLFMEAKPKRLRPWMVTVSGPNEVERLSWSSIRSGVFIAKRFSQNCPSPVKGGIFGSAKIYSTGLKR